MVGHGGGVDQDTLIESVEALEGGWMESRVAYLASRSAMAAVNDGWGANVGNDFKISRSQDLVHDGVVVVEFEGSTSNGQSTLEVSCGAL